MENVARSSGISIPLFLKQKWRRNQQEDPQQTDPDQVCDRNDHQKQEGSDDDHTNNYSTDDKKDTTRTDLKPKFCLESNQTLTQDQTCELSNRVFTTSELEERIWKTQIAMFEIQRQLHRGEEIYYEDTYNHGSIYKGWDAFVDMKDIGTTSTSGSCGTQTSNIRRLPADSRWFSTSCGSTSHIKFPSPFPPPLESNASSTAKLQVISEERLVTKSLKETLATTKATAERGQLSSARIRQRTTTPTLTALSFTKSSNENPKSSDVSSIPKTGNNPAVPVEIGICSDLGGIKKKRKPITPTSGSNDSLTTKTIRKPVDDGTKRVKIAITTKVEGTTVGMRKGTNDASIGKEKLKPLKCDEKDGSTSSNNKSKKAEISSLGKQEKGVEATVPRKRGRPRRKV